MFFQPKKQTTTTCLLVYLGFIETLRTVLSGVPETVVMAMWLVLVAFHVAAFEGDRVTVYLEEKLGKSCWNWFKSQKEKERNSDNKKEEK